MGHDISVSVVIPTYNRAHLISKAIQSVLNQTYQDFELIIVNDASTDDTEAVVRSFDDTRIRYICHNKNKGGNAARNTAIKAAGGKYIGFLDDDDEWLPEKIEKQINKFQKPLNDNIGVVYTGFCYSAKEKQKVYNIIPHFRGKVYTRLLKGNILGGSTPLIKRECFQKVGFFDETLSTCQDWDMWIRLSKYFEFDFTPDILARHYVHGKQISANLDAKIEARKGIMSKYQADLYKHLSILSRHLNHLGKLYYVADKKKEGRRYMWRAIKANPFSIRNYMHIVMSLLMPYGYERLLKKRWQITNEIRFYY